MKISARTRTFKRNGVLIIRGERKNDSLAYLDSWNTSNALEGQISNKTQKRRRNSEPGKKARTDTFRCATCIAFRFLIKDFISTLHSFWIIFRKSSLILLMQYLALTLYFIIQNFFRNLRRKDRHFQCTRIGRTS